MAVKGEWVRWGAEQGYFAYPERAALPVPGVIVIQEIWGVEENIEDVTRRIAASGYAALAPDLYASGRERPPALARDRIARTQAFGKTLPPGAWGDPTVRDEALAKLPEKERTEIGETFGRIFGAMGRGLDPYIPALRSAVAFLRAERAETRGQKVACVGFCMGGGLSALLACEEPELSGAAIYYGSAPPEVKIPAVRCPVIGFYGANDPRVNAGIPAFEAAMAKAGKYFERHIYDGAGHAFFNDSGGAYEVRAARDSFARLLGFFGRTIAT
jgi:carboxymethylenebutenolidase